MKHRSFKFLSHLSKKSLAATFHNYFSFIRGSFDKSGKKSNKIIYFPENSFLLFI